MYIQNLGLYYLIAHIDPVLSDHELSLVLILPVCALFLEILESLVDLRRVVEKQFGQFLVLKGLHTGLELREAVFYPGDLIFQVF